MKINEDKRVTVLIMDISFINKTKALSSRDIAKQNSKSDTKNSSIFKFKREFMAKILFVATKKIDVTVSNNKTPSALKIKVEIEYEQKSFWIATPFARYNSILLHTFSLIQIFEITIANIVENIDRPIIKNMYCITKPIFCTLDLNCMAGTTCKNTKE